MTLIAVPVSSPSADAIPAGAPRSCCASRRRHVRPWNRDQRERRQGEQRERGRRGHRPSVPVRAACQGRRSDDRPRRAPTTTRRLSGPFDYRVEDGVDVGSIVEIPFGHQTLEGVVVGLAETTDVPDEKLVAPKAVRADTLPRDLVDLARWMAEEYCSTPARALALVTPPPGKAKTYLLGRADRRRGKLTESSARCCPAAGADGRGPPGAAAAREARAGGDRASASSAGRRGRTRPRTSRSSSRRPSRTRSRRSRRRPARRTCCTA